MIRRLRMVLPPTWVLATLAASYLLLEGATFSLERAAGEIIPANLRPGVYFPMWAALAYGFYRVIAFHPFYRPEYRSWLERSPWSSRKPLPLGPVSLVWEDGVVLSLLALLCLVEPGLDPVRLSTFFLISYLAALGVTLGPSGACASAYVMAFGLGLVIRLTPEPRSALVAAGLLAPISQLGLKRSLRRFPWPLEWQSEVMQALIGDRRSHHASTACGWPFDQLGLKWAKTDGPRRREALLIGPLVGWWVLALGALIVDPRSRENFVVIVVILGVFFVSFAKLCLYLNGTLWPISFAGRLVSLRWIIPGFDVILVAPLCTLIIPAASCRLLRSSTDLDTDFCFAVSLSLGILIATNMGPSLKRWQLTGRHRIVQVKPQEEMVPVG